MKPWQKGLDLDYLIAQTKRFSHYNSFSLSPFSEVKKNNIPDMLLNDTFRCIDDVCVFTQRTVKMPSNINMYQNVCFGQKMKDDVVIENLSFENFDRGQLFVEYLNDIKQPTWIETWTEDEPTNAILKSSNAKKIGTKISTFAELKDYWFLDVASFFGGRDHPIVPDYEFYNLAKLKLNSSLIEPLVNSIRTKLNILPEFINHYSNYNKGKSWSAISLRGYRPEPEFMTKPSEMNNKWKEENKDLQFEMQDTTLYKEFSEVRELVSMLNAEEIHRIRFMKLSKGQGELQRHTDLVDEDSGIANGKLMRIHFPIVTNENVLFNSWRVTGEKQTEHMKTGEAWFLDTRKPHRAINGGEEDRIHLVIDVVANESVRSLL